MSDLKLKLAFWDCDRTRALANGAIKIDGVDATFQSAHIVSEIFERMIRHREFAYRNQCVVPPGTCTSVPSTARLSRSPTPNATSPRST